MTATRKPEFLPSRTLGIQPTERGALIRTLRHLEKHDLEEHFQMAFVVDDRTADAADPTRLLNADCGSSGCLLGWAWALSKGAAFHLPEAFRGDVSWRGFIPDSSPLSELFFPDSHAAKTGLCDRHNLSAVTQKQATTALRNFLTTGSPRWKKTCK